jgi:hypothetical protein
MSAAETSRPASTSSTRAAGSSLSRDANTHPAEPPPMMRKSLASEEKAVPDIGEIPPEFCRKISSRQALDHQAYIFHILSVAVGNNVV